MLSFITVLIQVKVDKNRFTSGSLSSLAVQIFFKAEICFSLSLFFLSFFSFFHYRLLIMWFFVDFIGCCCAGILFYERCSALCICLVGRSADDVFYCLRLNKFDVVPENWPMKILITRLQPKINWILLTAPCFRTAVSFFHENVVIQQLKLVFFYWWLYEGKN